MSIWNKVLVGFVIVAAMTFAYMGMRMLKTQKYWADLTQTIERKTAAVAKENELLSNGSSADSAEPVMGIKQYQEQIEKLVELRGRVWTNCAPKNANPQTGQVSVTTDRPVPNLIPEKATLFVFEESETAKGARYIGKFTVTAVADTSVAITPVEPMNQRELARLVKSPGPWVMYEKMPSDNHWSFAHLNEAQKKERLPAATLDEFLHDGEKATWAIIDEEWKLPGELVDNAGKPLRDDNGNKIADATGKYQRPLREYGLMFTNRNLDRTMMGYIFAAIQDETASLQTAAAEAKLQITSRTQQIATLKASLAKLDGERTALTNHLAALTKKASQLSAEVDRMLAVNKGVAAQIAKAQLDAAKRIDSRAPTMANSTDSGK